MSRPIPGSGRPDRPGGTELARRPVTLSRRCRDAPQGQGYAAIFARSPVPFQKVRQVGHRGPVLDKDDDLFLRRPYHIQQDLVFGGVHNGAAQGFYRHEFIVTFGRVVVAFQQVVQGGGHRTGRGAGPGPEKRMSKEEWSRS